MKNLVTTVFVFIVLMSNIAIAQEAINRAPNQYEESWRLKQLIRDKLNLQELTNPVKYSDIKGSPYLNDSFQDGQYFLNGETQGHFSLRFNIYNDQIEILTDASPGNLTKQEPSYDAFLKTENSKVILDGKTIKPYYYNDESNNLSIRNFIEINKTDKYILLLRKRCLLTPAKKAISPNQADRAARFTIYDEYYILDQNEKYPKKIELKQRKLLKVFPEQADALKDYMRKEDIDLKKEEDLVKLANYMYTL